MFANNKMTATINMKDHFIIFIYLVQFLQQCMTLSMQQKMNVMVTEIVKGFHILKMGQIISIKLELREKW